MPRVLIVDDHPIVRMGVRAMLDQAPGFEVCGEAGSTVEALRLLSAENPDVTLLDLMLGGRGGADFVAQCLRACPRTRILVLSQHDEAPGAHGYLMKGEAMEDLVDALETVLRGDIAVSSCAPARAPLSRPDRRALFGAVQSGNADLPADWRRPVHGRHCF